MGTEIPLGRRSLTFSHRRYARETAMMALCLAEGSKLSMKAALDQAFDWFDDEEVRMEVLPPEEDEGFEALGLAPRPVPEEVREPYRRFATLLANGVWDRKFDIDNGLDAAMPNYTVDRLAAVDRNVLRLGTWELFHLDYVPPLVTINEFIEIAKKYATAESGRFVNGVLATMLRKSPKAQYDPATAPQDPEFKELERIFREPERPVVEEEIEEGSDEAKRVKRYGLQWTLKGGDKEIPPLTE
jgi:transcription antitermination factor NusB